MTANYAVLFFLIGFLILTPLASVILNSSVDMLTGLMGKSWFKASQSDVCKMVIPYVTSTKNSVSTDIVTVFSTVWVSMMAFFGGYMLTNSLELYKREPVDTELEINTSSASDIEQKVNNRKSQALIAIVSIILFTLVSLFYRYYTGCENIAGMGLTLVIFGALGMSWYKVLSKVGEDRLSDLFGIANRLLPPSAIQNAPIACVPIRV
jgi:hypothetical protein